MMIPPTRPVRHDPLSFTRARVLSTGLPALDRVLPGGGWPWGEAIELIGEPATSAPLLLPALRTLSWDEQWITLIAPPAAFVEALRHQAGTDPTRFRCQTRTRRPLTDAARAVAAGTSTAVLVWAEWIDESAIAALRAAVAGREVLVAVLHPGAGAHRPVGSLRLAVETTPAGSLTVRRLVDPDEDRLTLDPVEMPRFTPPDRQAAVSP